MASHAEKQLNFAINKNIEVLIQQIEPLTKENQAKVNITPLLEEFYKNVVQSETYLQKGVFTINFAKAATFLDHAFYIYSKQVDLLWDMSISSQRRYLSYDDDTKEKAEAQKKLEELAQKGKRGRKKKVVEIDPNEDVDWHKVRLKIKKYCRRALANIADFDFKNELDITEIDPSTLSTFKNLTPIKNWHVMYPDKYVMWPYIQNNDTTVLDEECWCRNGNLTTNYLDFQFPEIQRKFAYNYTKNKKLSVVGCDVTDQALQHFVMEYGICPSDFTTETYQSFKRYLSKYLINGPSDISLIEQRKKLCPRRTSIHLTRLPVDVVQQHLKRDLATPGPSGHDSGFCEDMDTTGISGSSKETTVLSKELSTSSKELRPTENRSELVEKSSLRRSPDISSEDVSHLNNDEREHTKVKRKIIHNEETEPVRKKPLKKKEIFRWLKTTTTALKRFERFFYKHYLTEDGEGELIAPDFSSDEEDILQSETSETAMNESQTLGDSGFIDSSALNESQEQLETTMEISNTQESQRSSEESRNSEGGGLPADFEVTETDEMMQRYIQWNDYIRAELKRYGQKDFNIHEYGTRIIDTLSKEEKPKKFAEVVQDSSRNDIVRYFAAALQLVNTENIRLTNWKPGEVARDLEITLLSTERHHEHLDNYQAPSKEIVEENIKQLENTNASSISAILQNQENDRRHDEHTTVKKTYKRVKLSN